MRGVNDGDPRQVYADIIDLPHHQSAARPHMSLYDRAAQFSPFAALSGYDAMVTEEARLTDSRRELWETDLELLDQRLRLVAEAIENKALPEITVTYFAPDERKAGGSYQSYTGTVKRVDLVKQKLVFYAANGRSDGEMFGLEQLTALHGDLLDRLDNSLDAP